MKKLVVGFVATSVLVVGCQKKNSETTEFEIKKGFVIYKNNCSMCHWETVTPEQIRDIRKMVKEGKKPPFSAPPMSEVSARVKKFYPTEEKFVAFVKDYITNPSKEKGVCLPVAYELFGVMPPVGKSMSEDSKEAVAKWLYYRFNMSWEEFIKKHPH